jgi:protein subunit release factor A
MSPLEEYVEATQEILAARKAGRKPTDEEWDRFDEAIMNAYNMMNPELSPGTLKVDVDWRNPAIGWVGRLNSSVRVTHLPTGLWAQSDSERSQIANKAKAMEELKHKVALHNLGGG